MDTKTLEDAISKFIYDLETEDRLVRVGLKEVSQTAKIYKRYRELFDREALEKVKAEVQKTRDPKKKEILERLYFTQVGSFIGLALSPEEDKITTFFSKAKVKVNGEDLAYYEISPRIAKEAIFEKRERYDDAIYSVISKMNPKRKALLLAEIKLLASLGFSGYIDYFQKGKHLDYKKFAAVIGKIIRDTDKLWFRVMEQVSKDVFKRPFKNIGSCHLVYLRSISMYDNYYPKEKVVSTFERWTHDIGLSDLLSSIQIDDKDRPKKNPRAVCYWPKPPEEVNLVIKPIGGEQDFEAMFHEGGHALHGAAIDKGLPYSLKTLAHSNALTETYAFILEDLVFDSDWLSTYLNVSTFSANRIKNQAYFVNLMMLRRYLGKFLYEYEMFSGNTIRNYSSSPSTKTQGKLSRGVSSKNTINFKVSPRQAPPEAGQARTITERLIQGPALYKKNLDKTTGFVHNTINWLSDMDSGFYSAEYLRAWIGAAQIKDYLLQKFGKRWFLNQKAGKFLRDLWSRGVTDELEDVVKRLGYKPWDISFLIKGYKEILKV